MDQLSRILHRTTQRNLPLYFVLLAPELALAQASPFLTGATALQTNLLAWLTPIAIILVMVLGGMAMANRIPPETFRRCLLCVTPSARRFQRLHLARL
jgi:TrbC/VIRB2 pilin